MTIIKAAGKTDFGVCDVVIKGDRIVETIMSSMPVFADFIRWNIENAVGSMANNYHPEAGTMLQAYAACLNIFRENDVEVVGELETIPEDEEGVIY